MQNKVQKPRSTTISFEGEIINNNKQQTPQKNPSMILYKVMRQCDPDEFKIDYYPPPQYLRPKLQANIKEIIEKNSKSQVEINPIRKKVKNKYESQSDKTSFLYPKNIDENGRRNQSRIKRQFINAYKELFISEGKQAIVEHPNAVNQILFSGLSASAVASYKWNSVQAKRNISRSRVECPEFSEYPLSPRAIVDMEVLHKKVQGMKQISYTSKRNKSHQLQQDYLINSNDTKLKTYLSSLLDLNNTSTEVYGTFMEEYNDILKYCNATKTDFNTFDIDQAEKDVVFIQQSQKQFYENPAQWLLKKGQKITQQLESPKKRGRSLKYIDTDNIFIERPNSMPNTQVYFGINKDLKKNIQVLMAVSKLKAFKNQTQKPN